jgi:hypothetical protein
MPILELLLSSIGPFLADAAIQIVSDVAKEGVGSFIDRLGGSSDQGQLSTQPVNQGKNENIRNQELQYLQDKAKRDQELVIIQQNLASMREIEVRAGIEIAVQDLQLRRQALDFAKNRLKQEGTIAGVQLEQIDRVIQLRERELQILAQELTEKRRISDLHLQLVQQNKAVEIDLKLKELQSQWDQENWSGVLSREEMRRILLEGRDKHRLLMLVSPPDIEGSSDFNINLYKAVQSELKKFMEDNYPLDKGTCPVEFYGRFFKRSVFDAEVKQYERSLFPVPTIIIYSNVTDEKIYFHIHTWGLTQPETKTFTWNWLEERNRLETSEGKTKNESSSIIQNAIIKIHQLLAAFWADLYYLQINPYHEIRLFKLKSDIPTEWLKSEFETLQNFQKEQLANYEASLINSPNRNIVNLSDSLPKPRLAVRMTTDQKKSQIIEPSSSPSVYKLKVKEDWKDNKMFLSRCSIGSGDFPPPEEKVIMVVGETGSGKSTLINGMINYILGVEWKDEFRFKLIAEEPKKSQADNADSATKSITAYTLYPMEGSRISYRFTIIDTPGFGDTEGLQRDKFTIDQIRKFFTTSNGIDHLDGIGFVVKNSDTRLEGAKKYIFDKILSIFGNDIEKNIFMMVTFADGSRPPVVDTLKKAEIKYSELFKFNNSALFAKNDSPKEEDDDDDSDFNKMFWDLGFKSFKKFFSEFEKLESVSLTLTREVLNERKHLETVVDGLLPQIQVAQNKLNRLLQTEDIVKQNEAEINANKNFTRTIIVPKSRRENTKAGQYVTNCRKCNCTCHENCAFNDDSDKFKCSAMENAGDPQKASCGVCSGHCSWRDHVNNNFYYENYEEVEQITIKELKKNFDTATANKTLAERILEGVNLELEKECEKILTMTRQVQKCLSRLDVIALKPNPLTELDYYDLQIESQKSEKKPGWEERVAFYKEARKFAETLATAKSATDIDKKPDEDIKAWAEKLISNLKQERKSQNKLNTSTLTSTPNKQESEKSATFSIEEPLKNVGEILKNVGDWFSGNNK